MNYTIESIETEYSGVKFRSRLEAKWARFFDICGWTWTYEPFDLKGWIAQLVRCPVCSVPTFYNSLHTKTCVVSGCDLSEAKLAPDSGVVNRVFKMVGNDMQWKPKTKRRLAKRYRWDELGPYVGRRASAP